MVSDWQEVLLVRQGVVPEVLEQFGLVLVKEDGSPGLDLSLSQSHHLPLNPEQEYMDCSEVAQMVWESRNCV